MSLNYSFVRGYLVDLIGIEPMTSSMPWKRAPSCATGPLEEGLRLFSRMHPSKSTRTRRRAQNKSDVWNNVSRSGV
jgi:hypothetical protein